jgi:hypothetical protein
VRPSYDDHCTARCVRGFIPVANVLSYSHCGRAIGQQSNDCWLTNISVSPDHALAFAFSTSWTNYIRFFPAFSPHYGCVTFRLPSGGLTLIVWTQKWGFSCNVQRRPPADMFLNESLPPKTSLQTPCSRPPWPWFSREKSPKIFKVS